MVIGSMIPDLPYFVPSRFRPTVLNAELTHAAIGPVSDDCRYPSAPQ